MSPVTKKKKKQLAECIVNKLHAINKTWDETRQWVRGNAWLLFWPHCLWPVACRLDTACAFARSKTCLRHWSRWPGEDSHLTGMEQFSDELQRKQFLLLRLLFCPHTFSRTVGVNHVKNYENTQLMCQLMYVFSWTNTADIWAYLGHTVYERTTWQNWRVQCDQACGMSVCALVCVCGVSLF